MDELVHKCHECGKETIKERRPEEPDSSVQQRLIAVVFTHYATVHGYDNEQLNGLLE